MAPDSCVESDAKFFVGFAEDVLLLKPPFALRLPEHRAKDLKDATRSTTGYGYSVCWYVLPSVPLLFLSLCPFFSSFCCCVG